jgi:hypothetical protein
MPSYPEPDTHTHTHTQRTSFLTLTMGYKTQTPTNTSRARADERIHLSWVGRPIPMPSWRPLLRPRAEGPGKASSALHDPFTYYLGHAQSLVVARGAAKGDLKPR